MFTRATQCMRDVLDPSVSAFSLSLYRHPFIYTLFNSLFSLIINNITHVLRPFLQNKTFILPSKHRIINNTEKISDSSHWRCSSPPRHPVYPRRVDPSPLPFSLSSGVSSHRHSHISLLFNIIHTQKIRVRVLTHRGSMFVVYGFEMLVRDDTREYTYTTRAVV